jgi:hypothetical protein
MVYYEPLQVKNAVMIYTIWKAVFISKLIRHKLRNPTNSPIQHTFSQSIKVKTVLLKNGANESLWRTLVSWIYPADGSFQIKLTPKLGKTPYRTHVVIQIDQKRYAFKTHPK